jgi:hypothetical protein
MLWSDASSTYTVESKIAYAVEEMKLRMEPVLNLRGQSLELIYS